MKAYFFINISPGKSADAVRELRRVDGVKSADLCWGLPDVIALVEAADLKALRDVVLNKIQKIGGVSQTTPYIGHPAYKAMGGRAAYTLATALVVGLGGTFGYVAFVAGALPRPVLAPILVFIGLEIAGQSYLAPPRRHAAAVTLALLPSVAQLVAIFLSQIQNGALMMSALDPEAAARASGITNVGFIHTCGVMVMLANGFILTALLWGSAAAFLIDRRVGRASAVLVVCGVLSFFGFIHSVLPSGGVYLPWRPAPPAIGRRDRSAGTIAGASCCRPSGVRACTPGCRPRRGWRRRLPRLQEDGAARRRGSPRSPGA